MKVSISLLISTRSYFPAFTFPLEEMPPQKVANYEVEQDYINSTFRLARNLAPHFILMMFNL